MAADVSWKFELYTLLKNGELDKAENLVLEKSSDLSSKEDEDFLKTIKFWKNRSELFCFSESNGELLLDEWEKFLGFLKENKIDNKKLINSLKVFIYSKAIDFLIDAYRISPIKEKEILFKLGRSFYEIGLVENSLETFEYISSISSEKDPRIFLWLGNLYFEVGESDLSMLMYNDAFFYFSQLISLEDIKDPRIKKMADNIKLDGFQRDDEILEWLPVYCYLYDILTVKRKLEYSDFVELREKILNYERSLQANKSLKNVFLPRLINHYIWLIDYYLFQANAIAPVRSVLERILELLDGIEIEEVRKKLKERTEFLVNNLLKKKESVVN
ncbi:MAG: hypothetical protein ACP5QT_05240 [Brevinematia bacterium]